MRKGDKSFEFQSRLPGGTLSPVLSPHVGGRVLVCSLCYGNPGNKGFRVRRVLALGFSAG